MKKPVQSILFAFVILIVLLSGCAPAPISIPSTFTPEPTSIPFVVPTGDFKISWDTYNSEYNSLGGILTIRRLGSKYTQTLVMSDKSCSTIDLTVISEGDEIKLTDLPGNSFGDYMVISSNGYLSFYDKQGIIYSVSPLNSGQAPITECVQPQAEQNKEKATQAPTATATLPPTKTHLPTPTYTPGPTNTPSPPSISPNTQYYRWGDYDNTRAQYSVWGADLSAKMNIRCSGFKCDGKDLRLYDPTVWFYLGSGDPGSTTFNFEDILGPGRFLDTFVIAFHEGAGMDAFYGTAPGGEPVYYGYRKNSYGTYVFNGPYMDSAGGVQMDTSMRAEQFNLHLTKPCGFFDPTIGDGNYNVTIGPGDILFNIGKTDYFSPTKWDRTGYLMKDLTVVTAALKDIEPGMICP